MVGMGLAIFINFNGWSGRKAPSTIDSIDGDKLATLIGVSCKINNYSMLPLNIGFEISTQYQRGNCLWTIRRKYASNRRPTVFSDVPQACDDRCLGIRIYDLARMLPRSDYTWKTIVSKPFHFVKSLYGINLRTSHV